MTVTRLKTAGAAVLLSMMSVTPVFAQAAIQEPGVFAFYHPNADVLNGGAPVDTANASASLPISARDTYAYMGDADLRGRKTGSRHVAADIDAVVGPQGFGGRACIPAARVGASATQPWDNGPPCEPSPHY
jgi:hypothetical protein